MLKSIHSLNIFFAHLALRFFFFFLASSSLDSSHELELELQLELDELELGSSSFFDFRLLDLELFFDLLLPLDFPLVLDLTEYMSSSSPWG
jgi:hypothetical protein